MSGRVRVTLADGRRVTGFRKTLARREYVPPHERPDTRLLFMLPLTMSLYSPGEPTGIIGVSIEPGPIVVSAGKSPEWVYRQMAKWIQTSQLRFQEAIYTLTYERGDIRRSQTVIVQPDGIVEYPRGARKPLRFEL